MALPPSRGRSRPGDHLAPAPEPQATFPFPRMTSAEIQDDMKNIFNCPITRETLKNPSVTDAKAVMDFFIEEVYGKRAEDMAQPEFESLECVDYPELYEQNIPTLHYIMECQKLCQAASFNELSIRDILAPEKTRFLWQLSALINFSKFRATRLELFDNKTRQADDLIETERKNLAETSNLRQNISSIEEKRTAEEPEVERVRQTVSEFSMELHELHKQQRALVDETREIKEMLGQKNKTSASQQAQRTKLRVDNERMAAKVVSSPDRMKGEIDSMRESLQSENEHIASSESERRSLNHLAAELTAAKRSAKEAYQAAEENIAIRSKVEEFEQSKHQYESKNAQSEGEVVAIEEKQDQVKRWLESAEAKITRVDEQQSEIEKGKTEEDHVLVQARMELTSEKEKMEQILQEKNREKEDLASQAAQALETLKYMYEDWFDVHNTVNGSRAQMHTNVQKALSIMLEENSKLLSSLSDS
ncbi:kinetochore protein NUF2-like protein [Gracilaria domingensis]|nr:kinetochore protein NUF2-like protein [Gracilaria domingensis]